MSMIQCDLLLGQEGGAGYQIERSLRFNGSDSPFLSHSVTSSSNQKCTISFWLKRTTLGGTHYICATHPFDDHMLWINGDQLSSTFAATSSVTWSGTSAPVFRDPSAWYHVVIAFDTTKASASDRVRLYVNGNTVSWSTYIGPVQNTTFRWNNTQVIGRYDTTYGSFYLAEFYTIDGQQLTANDFGQFDSNGIWQPKKYTGTFGSGGSYLSFADNSAATATTLGKDTSGNSNNWTPNNLSVTAGAGNDSLTDSPTNYGTDTGAGGSVRGNYCTLNPLHVGTNQARLTLRNGNLDASWAASGSTYAIVTGSIAISSGKWYWESTQNNTSRLEFGIVPSSASLGSNYAGAIGFAYASTGSFYYNGSYISPGTSFTTNDICGIALDLDAGKIWFSKNGTWIAAGNPASGTNPIHSGISGTFVPAYSDDSATISSPSVSCNFGQRPFAYTAPSGFKALCTQNLPTPTITNGATAMDVKLYSGNSSTQTISGLGFSPDLVWIKMRSSAAAHALYDTVRGATNRIQSSSVAAEELGDTGLTAFNSNGFSLGSLVQVNGSATYAAWAWDAGSSTVTNTSGTISSQVRANASAGFSVVTYTGNGTGGATVGHGLGVAPSLIVIKNRSVATDWPVGHQSIGWSTLLYLDLTSAQNTASANFWNNTAPTSSVFTLGTIGALNGSGNSFVAYCWAPVAGYSAFGSYTGNGSADGPFVYTGFRPKFLLVKLSSGSIDDWFIQDTTRSPYNVSANSLSPNNTNAESGGTFNSVDILSNGFKPRDTNQNFNGSGFTYIYACFAENPFALARAR